MVSTFTPNINIEEPARGDDVGTWDTPVNNNSTLLDLCLGGTTTISGAAGNVVLAAAQFQSKQIVINSTLTASIQITFPTSFKKSYEIQNVCTGTSAFVVQLLTTAAGGQIISCAPGEIFDVVNDGVNLKYKNFGRIGSYWDHGGSSLPNWVQNCTVPPYLSCDGTTFSSAQYPQLTLILGSTTLPDSRGRARFALDQTTGRLSSAVAGFSPNSVGSGGGNQNVQAHTHVNVLNDLGHTHNYVTSPNNTNTGGGGFAAALQNGNVATGSNNSTPMSITNASFGTGASGNVPPAYIGGITLIRAG